MSDDNAAQESASILDNLLVENPDDPTPESPPNHKATRPSVKDRLNPPRTAKATKPKARVAAQKKDEFVEPLTQIYTMLGAVLTPFDPVGPVIVASAPNCAQSLNDLAAENENVRKALRSLTQASAMGAVIVAHAPIFISLASNHMPGALPRGMRVDGEGPENATDYSG